MPVLEGPYAWQIIRDALTRAWQHDQVWAETGRDQLDRPILCVAPGGRWQSDIEVDAEAARLFDTLLPLVARDGAFVMAQLGQSLDGRIATLSGHSHYVTGEQSRVHLHRLRALVDAVVIGAGTACADNPQLTVRHVEGRHPLRVVLDPNARVPADSGLFTDGAASTLHLIGRGRPCHDGVDTLQLEHRDGEIAIADILAALAERGCRRLLIEGGGQTISRFLAADALDRLHSVVAPLLIGSGLPALSLPVIDRLDAARRPPCRTFALGDDVLFDMDLNPAPVRALHEDPRASPR